MAGGGIGEQARSGSDSGRSEHDGLSSALTGLLSGGMSGFALNHADVGGYTGGRDTGGGGPAMVLAGGLAESLGAPADGGSSVAAAGTMPAWKVLLSLLRLDFSSCKQLFLCPPFS